MIVRLTKKIKNSKSTTKQRVKINKHISKGSNINLYGVTRILGGGKKSKRVKTQQTNSPNREFNKKILQNLVDTHMEEVMKKFKSHIPEYNYTHLFKSNEYESKEDEAKANIQKHLYDILINKFGNYKGIKDDKIEEAKIMIHNILFDKLINTESPNRYSDTNTELTDLSQVTPSMQLEYHTILNYKPTNKKSPLFIELNKIWSKLNKENPVYNRKENYKLTIEDFQKLKALYESKHGNKYRQAIHNLMVNNKILIKTVLLKKSYQHITELNLHHDDIANHLSYLNLPYNEKAKQIPHMSLEELEQYKVTPTNNRIQFLHDIHANIKAQKEAVIKHAEKANTDYYDEQNNFLEQELQTEENKNEITNLHNQIIALYAERNSPLGVSKIPFVKRMNIFFN